LIELSQVLDGEAWKLEPFPPGCVEEYEVEETGRTRAVVKKQFYNIGDRPFFKPLVPYDCESFFLNLFYSGETWPSIPHNLTLIHTCTSEVLHAKLIVWHRSIVSLTSYINSSVVSGDSK